MQRIWTNRNVDLDVFAEKICEFLEENDFEIDRGESENKLSHQITASGSLEYRIEGQIMVTIAGEPQDFSLTLERVAKSKPKKYSYPITLTTFLGGGLLLRDEFKSDENFLNLRKDLWAFADRTVINITNSATKD
jgi:hypothetical protein